MVIFAMEKDHYLNSVGLSAHTARRLSRAAFDPCILIKSK